ncbi:LAETG motif-containing sortase-dependent surface protein [Peterkaempfera bronchialis]|uniref:LPXTG cell wall anchor domain-containing protein n=1 Tax=Peterkaempfera bronchialis TaxID=2126346 RepID=A0A345SZQ1_9ACTN|nr:LAETG motif-containing sortase-dependent surface protein [Peterkaempfera bronchialis]AXI79206.1 LPXTG cell wall anchor domain-containing protein [Peterkaempfera bronchialis]
MGERKAAQRSPLTITAAAAGGAVALALILGPVASAASSDASAEVAAARQDKATQALAERAAAESAAVRSAARAAEAQSAAGLRLADTGGVDTTPYLLGGAALLVVGAGMLAVVRRREAPEAG